MNMTTVLDSSAAWFAGFVVVLGVLYATGGELMDASIAALVLVGGAYIVYVFLS